MKPVNFTTRTAASVAIAGLLALPSSFLLLDATSAPAQAQSAATAVQLEGQVTDQAGVLSGAEKNEVQDLLKKGISESDVKLYVVFVDSMPTVRSSTPRSCVLKTTRTTPW